ncbi:MAG: 3-phosphoshikimate 1-carboxyvinyltransferase [Firmicutes bacterium]|nr:3-phosphoshikimate 1-carboxyvinyltransferase [Bacillota bacterium]
MARWRILPQTAPLQGEIRVPGDKSISHRAAILGLLAEGFTEIRGFLEAEDCLHTLEICRQLGAAVERLNPGHYKIGGRGLGGLREPEGILDVGNSGTSIRLLAGVLAAQRFFAVITGDASIRRRPMDRVVEPLRAMGARIAGRNRGSRAPLAFLGLPEGTRLRGREHTLPVASAQVKSALLLAGLWAAGETVVREPGPSRDHTERLLQQFGARLERRPDEVHLAAGNLLRGQNVDIPGDFSSAAFFLAAAAAIPGSRLVVRGVGLNPTRTGLLDALQAMGARISVQAASAPAPGQMSQEPKGDVTVEAAPLRGVEIGGEMIPRLIDEIPALAVAALAAEGRTVIRDAAELRVKECDRIAALVAELGRLGARVWAREDGLEIEGPAVLAGGCAFSEGDHRMAMALAVAGLLARNPTRVEGVECVGTSFPSFAQCFSQVTGGQSIETAVGEDRTEETMPLGRA